MKIPEQWLPESVRCLRTYSRRDFGADLLAGVTVGLVALPLAMAFGIASGVTPQAGLYTAIVAGGLISALGGSRMQIGGPTGAFVVIVAGIVAKFGVAGLALVTMMAGAMLVLMGLTGLGAAVKFIPRPVTIGFTNGIALLIASTQIKDFLGLKTGEVPERVPSAHDGSAGAHRHDSLADTRRFRRVSGDHPSAAARHEANSRIDSWRCWAARFSWRCSGLPIETIGSKFGGIPAGFPKLSIPAFRLDQVLPLFPSALTVALSSRGGEPALGGGCRQHERNPAQLQRGTGGAGRCQSRFAVVWRHSGDGRDCAHGDKHPGGRQNARGRT